MAMRVVLKIKRFGRDCKVDSDYAAQRNRVEDDEFAQQTLTRDQIKTSTFVSTNQIHTLILKDSPLLVVSPTVVAQWEKLTQGALSLLSTTEYSDPR